MIGTKNQIELVQKAVDQLRNESEHVNTLAVFSSQMFDIRVIQISTHLELDFGVNVIQPIYGVKNPTMFERSRIERSAKSKIDMADAIYVVDINGHIDRATQELIEYAELQGKRVFYYSRKGDIETWLKSK